MKKLIELLKKYTKPGPFVPKNNREWRRRNKTYVNNKSR